MFGTGDANFSYFSFCDLVLKVEYEPVQLFELCPPQMRRQPKTYVIDRLKEEDMEILREKITKYYDSILERVKGFTYDIVPSSKQQAAREALVEMGRRASSEKKLMIQLLQQTHISSSHLDSLSLNSVFKQLVQKVTLWDEEFTLFVRNYLQTESSRAAAQLKRIFVDREVSGPIDVKGAAPIALDIPTDGRTQANWLSGLDSSKLPVLGSSPDSASGFEISFEIPASLLIRKLSMQLMTGESNLPEVGESPKIAVTLELDMTKITPFLLSTDNSVLVPSPTTETASIAEQENVNYDIFEEPEGVMYPRDEFFIKQAKRKSKLAMENLKTNDLPKSQSLKSFISTPNFKSPKFKEEEPRKNLLDEEETTEGLNKFTGVAAMEAEPGEEDFDSTPQQERTSIMQTISNLWTGNFANFLPLVYPS
jgi:hypothetical protein